VLSSNNKLQLWKRPLDPLREFAQAAIPNATLVYAGEGPLRHEVSRVGKTARRIKIGDY